MASPPPPHSVSEAIAAAIRLTKLDILKGRWSAVKTTLLEEDVVLLSPGLFKGRCVWRVECDGGALTLASAVPGYPDRYPDQRRFIILLDETMHHVLSIRSEFKGDRSDMVPEPSVTSAESQMRKRNIICTGPPDTMPKLTFLDALDAVLSKGVGSPFWAKEIWGSYVMYSEMKSASVPVWIVILRGMPPVESPGPRGAAPPPLGHGNRMVNFVDAMTGNVILATNTPLPDVP